MVKQRKIIHIDMDAFYASVEQRDNPELRGKPVVVGGKPGGRGVVCAASYEARVFGVRSAMPTTQAHQRCPQAVFVKPRFEVYRAVSAQIREIFHQYTDLVEPLSLDEAYLDVTENKVNQPSATLIANEIRARILQTTRLTASAGVAANKFLAKVASDVNKPNGICVITPQEAPAFLDALPIGRFYGVGKATEKKMAALGIHNGAGLRTWTREALSRHFGKAGGYYYDIVRGQDSRAVTPDRVRKSVGVEETFGEDLNDLNQLDAVLVQLAHELERRLKKSRFVGKTLTVKVRYADFETITRATTLETHMASSGVFLRIARHVLRQTRATEKKVRLLGLTAGNLEPADKVRQVQLTLPFEEEFTY